MDASKPAAGAPWRVLVLEVPRAIEDEAAWVLGGGTLGVEVASAGPGTSLLRVYLGPADDEGAWKARAARVLAAHGVDPEETAPVVRAVADERWVERWQASLAPIPLGERFVVLPTPGAAPAPGREPIRLVPGMAFGTGEHPTTRMCATALEEAVRGGSRWIDVGTGSGILAVVIARLGASRVLAVDTDPEAAHVAETVARQNGAAPPVEIRAGSIESRGTETFDGLVGNVHASFFLARAEEIAAAIAPGGVAIVSGILEDDASDIIAAFGAAGIDSRLREVSAPWACLAGVRRP